MAVDDGDGFGRESGGTLAGAGHRTGHGGDRVAVAAERGGEPGGQPGIIGGGGQGGERGRDRFLGGQAGADPPAPAGGAPAGGGDGGLGGLGDGGAGDAGADRGGHRGRAGQGQAGAVGDEAGLDHGVHQPGRTAGRRGP